MARAAAAEAVAGADGRNQYTAIQGLPALLGAIVRFYDRVFSWKIEESNVCVTTSGTQAIYSACQALIDPGDEVVVFEPFFPWYLPAIRLAGGVPKVVTLAPEDSFRLARGPLERAVGEKTKLVICNTPHNPTSHVYSDEELRLLADVVLAHPDVILISDEAYEGQAWALPHRKIAAMEGMFDRTLTLSTASKLCSLTGWRVGWAVGPPALVDGLKLIVSMRAGGRAGKGAED